MEYSVNYKNIKHAYVRVKDGKLVITISRHMKRNDKVLQYLLKQGEKLLMLQQKKQQITAFGKMGTTIFGEKISWKVLGLEAKKLTTKEKHLKKMLLEYTEELTHYYVNQLSNLVGEKYYCNSIKIKKLTAKWGYCTSNQDIIYALQLLHLPNSRIRYVIIHEVCHLREKNHSKKFRDLVERLYPEYKKVKKAMKNISLNSH